MAGAIASESAPEVKGFGLSPNPHDVIYDVMFVLDTNVLVAGLFSRRGASFWLLERILDGRLSIAVSVALALEYEDVLMRPAMLARGWADAEQISTVLDAILAQAVLVQPIRISRRPALPDPGDDLVLDCALEANADAIVTMNVRDFAAAFETYRLNILKPGELVAKLRKEQQ
jgi:putative PIN family toxin of toxin-antitoxin system